MSEVVARGKIMVDARKAIEKLRDHMLVDLHHYACEIARVAVAIGAKAIDVDYDADDTTFTWSGPPLAPEAIARARDHVLAPHESEEGDVLRLLGVAISAALGLEPSFVDVTIVTAAATTRIRFEPKEENAAITAVPTPPGMNAPSTRVHVRRRGGLGTFGRALKDEPPREVRALHATTRDAPLVVTRAGKRVLLSPRPSVVLRVDLDEPAATRAVLEILAPSSEARASTVFLERGVQLAAYTSILGGWEDPAGEPFPMRLVVDAKKLPTNASRSEIRLDADLVKRVIARVPGAIDAALRTLGALATGAEVPNVGHAVERLAGDPTLYEESLGAIVSHVAFAVRNRAMPDEAKALLSLPLLRDAIGAPITPLGLHGGSADKPLVVHTGPPLEAALAPWLGGVVWDRGKAVDRVYAALVRAPADGLIAMARDGYARRTRAFEHPATPPVLAASAAHVLREAFAVRHGPFAGLHGEIAILKREGGYRRSATARIFVEERLLDTMPLSGAALPIEIAIAWPGWFRARFAYDGVERDAALQRALVYALRVGAIAIGERLEKRDAEIARLAIVAWASATKELADGPITSAALGALADAPAWDTSSGRAVSTRELEAYAKRTGAICVTRAATTGEAIDRRPVVREDQAKLLAAFLPPATRLVGYDRPLAQRSFASRDLIAQEAAKHAVFVQVRRPIGEGILGIGESREIVYHQGEVVREAPRASRYGPATLVFDDPSAVPNDDDVDRFFLGKPGFGNAFTSAISVADEEQALLTRFIERCERGELDFGSHEAYVSGSLRALSGANDKAVTSAEESALRDRLRALPERAAREARARAKAAILATPPFEPLTDARTSALFEGIARMPRTTLAGKGGSATVWLSPHASLGTDATAQIALLYQGRFLATTTGAAFPIVALVDVTTDDTATDLRTFSSTAKDWVDAFVLEATIALAIDRVKASGFTNDLASLRLVCALVEAQPSANATLFAAIGEIPWPTIQGPTVKLIKFRGTLSYGVEHYTPFRTGTEPSPYDEPILHLPRGKAGDLARELLGLAGYTLGDVTEHVARLQARRAQGTAAPRLPGKPPAPGLRASLQDLGAIHVVGEIEIAETTAIACVDTRGVAEPIDVVLVAPARALFRADPGASKAAVAADLNAAIARQTRAIGKRLAELPPFARDAVRAAVCASIRAGTMQRGDDALALFPDTWGAFHSYAALKDRQIGITEDPPPYPAHDGLVIRANVAEAHALAKRGEVVDRTLELRQLRRGAERRATPPIEAMTLPPEVRAKCIFTTTVAEEGIEGEIGLLAPQHAKLRGIEVHTTRRSVCTIEDGTGWPAVAVLNDDSLTTTRGFDALANAPDVGRLRRALRAAATRALPTMLEAPPGALGVMRLPSGFLATLPNTPPIACMGILWLDPIWPERPEVHIEALDAIDPYRTPRIPNDIAKGHHRTPPLRGTLWICASGDLLGPALEQVFRSVRTRIAPLIHAAGRSFKKPPKEVLEAYAWDLALLGLLDDRNPVTELAKDRPDPTLIHVATIRAPHLLRSADEPVLPPATAPAPDARAWLAGEVARANADPPEPVELISTDDTQAEPSFLQGLVRRLVALVSPEPASPETVALLGALSTALHAMKLSGDPVEGVVEERRGRPVQFDLETQKLVVNTRHKSVKALEGNPARTLHLLVAAVSEINRELTQVSDAEELAILNDLLRDRDASS